MLDEKSAQNERWYCVVSKVKLTCKFACVILSCIFKSGSAKLKLVRRLREQAEAFIEEMWKLDKDNI